MPETLEKPAAKTVAIPVNFGKITSNRWGATNLGNWGQHTKWHDLFDRLCNRRGFYDNTGLASAFCLHTGRKRQEDFEAAKKKLRTWRSGERLPRRGNFLAVSALLGVADEPELERRWVSLYETAAGSQRRGEAIGTDATNLSPSHSRGWIAIGGAIAGAIFAAACLAAFPLAGWSGHERSGSGELPTVNYEGHVIVPLGTSRLVNGGYVSCDGSPPPAWETLSAKIPSTPLGTFEDGGIAKQVVRRCGKAVPVRAVLFTAREPGTEELNVLGAYIKLEVRDVTSGTRQGAAQ